MHTNTQIHTCTLTHKTHKTHKTQKTHKTRDKLILNIRNDTKMHFPGAIHRKGKGKGKTKEGRNQVGNQPPKIQKKN